MKNQFAIYGTITAANVEVGQIVINAWKKESPCFVSIIVGITDIGFHVLTFKNLKVSFIAFLDREDGYFKIKDDLPKILNRIEELAK